MKTCKTCKWWSPFSWQREKNGECKMMESHFDETRHPESIAVAYDSDGYHAGVKTRPEFGCIMWEKK